LYVKGPASVIDLCSASSSNSKRKLNNRPSDEMIHTRLLNEKIFIESFHVNKDSFSLLIGDNVRTILNYFIKINL
jgi:hypothetical protein